MNQRMLGTCGQPVCGKCCGEHTKKGSQAQKRRFRRIEKREVSRIVFEEISE